MTELLLGLGLGVALGALVTWQHWKGKAGVLVARLEAARAVQDSAAAQFENLANRIFEEKNARFKQESQEGLGQMLNPLKEKLGEFQQKVDRAFGEQVKEQVSLKAEIKNIIAVNEHMSKQAESLTRALKGDVKAQGNWGEVMLEKILEDSGLRKGVDYVVQGAGMKLRHAEDETRRLQPDVVVHLPEDKHVIIDAKVSLTHYERFISAEEETARAAALKLYLESVRTHVKGLSERRYQDTGTLGTPDFVLMFMPIEGAYALAVQEEPSLHRDAWEKKVVIVCPATLFATLRTIASVWKLDLQNKQAQEIARQGGALYDKVAGFVESMEKIGKQIGGAQRAYDDAFKQLSSGTGNILKRTQDLEALGVKNAKKIAPRLIGDEEEMPEREAG